MPGANLFHLHIAKTAGTSLRSAFERYGHKVMAVQSDFVFDPALHGDVDLFSGHAGYRAVEASPALRGRVVTLLRDPYDRLFSYYFHLAKLYADGHENSDRVRLAVKYSLDEFLAIRDHPHLIADLYNAMTWQLVHDAELGGRMDFRNDQPAFSDGDLVERAKANLSSFLVVGLQSRMDRFAERLKEATGFGRPLLRENDTPLRTPFAEIDAETRRRARPWIEMDIEVYEWALAQFGRR